MMGRRERRRVRGERAPGPGGGCTFFVFVFLTDTLCAPLSPFSTSSGKILVSVKYNNVASDCLSFEMMMQRKEDERRRVGRLEVVVVKSKPEGPLILIISLSLSLFQPAQPLSLASHSSYGLWKHAGVPRR
jgi:hypothetical protein